MGYQSVFQRYELKYLLTRQQQETVLREMKDYMALDQYGKTVIRNVYYDTDDYLLIRRSIEKPAYKEKLRLRSYAQAVQDTPIFVELKKKYASVVYKRRLSMPEAPAMAWLSDGNSLSPGCQISREIDYFRDFYGNLRPVVFLSYQRRAYYAKDGSDFRVTFDDEILCRDTELTLTAPAYGTPILDEGKVLMEIKCSGGIPMWLTRVLSRERIYKTSFSKYGTAYQNLIFPKLKEEARYAGELV